MSNSVLKSGFVSFNVSNTRVIDPSELVAKRVEEGNSGVLRERGDEIPESFDTENVDEEGNPIDALTMDSGEEYIEEAPLPEEINAQCEAMLQSAQEEANRIIEDAKRKAEELKADAEREGQEMGYQAGIGEARADIDAARKDCEDRIAAMAHMYAEKIRNAEPEMVEIITNVYKNVFGDNFFSHRDVLIHLIDKALIASPEDEKLILTVSSEDYEMIMDARDSFSIMPEIRVNENYRKGAARIETATGIIDCGIDTELKELTRTLHVLSYEDLIS